MLRFHHVNLGVPVGGEDAQEAFLVDILGYRRAPTPQELDGLVRWYEDDYGSQVHLSEDPDHRPAARAHVAIEVGDELPSLEVKLKEAAFDCTTLMAEGRRLVFCQDPAGTDGSSVDSSLNPGVNIRARDLCSSSNWILWTERVCPIWLLAGEMESRLPDQETLW